MAPPPSILQVPGAKDIAVEFTSMSKTYNMPGWRIGFAAGNKKLIAALGRIKTFLGEKSPLLVRLLENPNLLEHESFTDLLWAVLHIKEELEFRFDLAELSSADATHVQGDLERAYRLLASQWLDYMRHLKANYPYLFMTAAHRNPFLEPETHEG